MPLPHLLLMLAAVVLAAGATVWAALTAGAPVAAIGLVALTGAALLHLSLRDDRG